MADAALAGSRPMTEWVARVARSMKDDHAPFRVEYEYLGPQSEDAAKQAAAKIMEDEEVNWVQLFVSQTMGTIKRVSELRWGN